ncbi:hypothetical protein EDD11_008570 [Mortierella claussenii]|nr:hypothetical protein EDD11_008570 [Mortierella claussenii]
MAVTATIMGRGAVRFVEPTSRLVNPSFTVVNTKQYIPLTGQSTFSGWSRSIRNGSSIVEAMTAMVNDTSRIPDALAGRLYHPRQYDYQVDCERLNILALVGFDTYQLDNNGCGILQYMTLGAAMVDEDATPQITRRSQGRWSIAAPATILPLILEMSTSVYVEFKDTSCRLDDNTATMATQAKDGMTSLPKTSITKCVFPSGKVISLTTSTIRFMATTGNLFSNVSRTLFGQFDELFITMDAAINNKTLSSKPFLFSEIKVSNSTLDTLSCYLVPDITSVGNFSTAAKSLTCTYLIVNVVIMKQQEVNPIIAEALDGSLPVPPTNGVSMDISYLQTRSNTRPIQLSLADIQHANSAAAEYFASLGQNFLGDWTRGQIVVIYDTKDVEVGLDIPSWLVVCVPVIASSCIVFLALAEYLLEGRYTYSLYKTIAIPMRTELNKFAPMLMRSKVDPVEFEGIPVIPAESGYENTRIK